MANNLKSVVYLSEDQYVELKTNKMLVVDDVTYHFDEDSIYVTPATIKPTALGMTAPTEDTAGEIGQFYLDYVSKLTYICTGIIKPDEGGVKYTWTQLGGGGSGVSQEDFDKLINNEIVIQNDTKNNLLLGTGATATTSSVAIGYKAKAQLLCVAVGNNSSASYWSDSVAIGCNAKAGANYANIQIGSGENKSNQRTLQIYDDNIYNADTHTLTVQNIEQNENKVYGILQGETAPANTLVGNIGQFYIDTVAKKLYQCTTINIEDLTYEWQIVGGVSQEDFDSFVNAYTVVIGASAQATPNIRATAIGNTARAFASNATAIGAYAQVSAQNSIQIGDGTNQTPNTLRVFKDNIYNHETHTLTVQNIELNGVDINTLFTNSNIINVEDTITIEPFKGVVNIKSAQYKELRETGTLTVGDVTINYTNDVMYAISDETGSLTFTGDSVLTSVETFGEHVQIIVEFETDSIHAGFDCILHPYDEAICFVTYDILVNGTPNFGTAYLNENGNVVINVPNGLTFSNIHAKYKLYGD